MTTSSLLAVTLAALGAVLFGLAAVRQHRAVQASTAHPQPTTGRTAAALRLVRQRSWLLGAGQAGLGGALHLVALSLAPISLVQPVGVLAVPVTVVATAIIRRRRPAATQVLGTLLSVAGVAALTILLLTPSAHPAVLPTSGALVTDVGPLLVVGGAVAVLLGRAPARWRCPGRAVVAAVLFGLNAVLVRIVAEVVETAPPRPAALVAAALVGAGLALPLGIWAMQSAYLVGSPAVVLCCLTLVDPVAAVLGGRLILQDDAAVTVPVLLSSVACAGVAAVGVVLLARGYPAGEAEEG